MSASSPACCEGACALVSRVAAVEHMIGTPPNEATGDDGRGLLRVVAELARAQRRNAAIVGVVSAIAVELVRGLSGVAYARLTAAPSSPAAAAVAGSR